MRGVLGGVGSPATVARVNPSTVVNFLYINGACACFVIVCISIAVLAVLRVVFSGILLNLVLSSCTITIGIILLKER